MALSRRKPDIDGFTHREITTSQSPSSAPVPHSPFLLGQIHEPVSPFSVLDSASDSSVFCSTSSRPLTRCPSAARPSTYLPPANPTQPTHPLSPIHPSIHQPLGQPTHNTHPLTHSLTCPPSTLDPRLLQHASFSTARPALGARNLRQTRPCQLDLPF